MNARKLASAYADAVLDYLETGTEQGILYKDDMFLFVDSIDSGGPPHLWIDGRWTTFVTDISSTTNQLSPDFCATHLRAQIIEHLIYSGKAQQLAAGIGISELH